MKYLKIVLILLILTTLIGCDQVTKHIAKEKLLGAGTVTYLNNLIKLQYAENPGAVLSIGSDLPTSFKVWVLAIIPGLIVFLMLIYVFSSRRLTYDRIVAYSLIIGGGISNLIDRFFRGFVIDFMVINMGPQSTGIFNFADVGITFGLILIIYLHLFSRIQSDTRVDPGKPL